MDKTSSIKQEQLVQKCIIAFKNLQLVKEIITLPIFY